MGSIWDQIENQTDDNLTDPISYFIDLIIQISKNLTKGRGLSKRGVNALFLFILTASLLYVNTNAPTELVGILKMYSIPIIFLIYFVYDLTKNIQVVDRFWRRIFQKTEFGYNNIIEGNVTNVDLEYNMLTLPFNLEQTEKILNTLRENEQFTPKAQVNLFHNTKIYRIDTFRFLRDSLINYEWVPSAICTFLRYTSRNLPSEFLDKIFEKYGKFPSVVFALSYFHHYKKKDSNIYFEMGYEFKYTKKLLTFFKILLFLTLSSLIATALVVQSDPQVYSKYLIFLGILIIITGFVSDYIRENHFIWAINKHLKKYGTLYLFSWDGIPGNDNVRIIEFLKQNFGIDWVKTAKIEKIDNDKTINISNEKNNILLKLNDKQTEVNLEINDVRTDKFVVKIERSKLNIYDNLNDRYIVDEIIDDLTEAFRY